MKLPLEAKTLCNRISLERSRRIIATTGAELRKEAGAMLISRHGRGSFTGAAG
jgi:hypothetical protein